MYKKLIIPVLVLALAMLACVIGGTTTAPTAVPTNVPPVVQQPTVKVVQPKANTIFTDDFTDPNSGWEVGSYNDGDVGYGDGFYFVTSPVSATNMYGAAGHPVDDVLIQVDGFMYSGPSNNNAGYGVICRLQTGSDNAGDGYYFRVSADGMYSVLLGSGGAFTSLLSGDKWHADNAIKTGDASNHLSVTCNGSHFIFKANGTTLWEGDDSTISSGDLGLMAITYEDNSTVEAHFKNFVAAKP